MKTNRISSILRPSIWAMLAVAIATLIFAGPANAQFKVVDDGIAASPKVRQMINERKAASTPAAKVQTPAMSCPKCTDVTTTEPNRQAKGAEILAGAATKVVTRHACTGCDVKLTVVGEGKAKHTVATHKWTAEVPNNLTCCASN